MSNTPSLPSYDEITTALTSSPTQFDAAQAHGLMCGLLCATSDQSERDWEQLLFGHKQKKPHAILEHLYEASYQQMNEFSFEFSLLLPEDDVGINQRAEALGLWCQGFLTGLEHVKIPIQNRSPSDVTEALNDLIEISQVNYGDIAENEEDETAYFELVEYVRLAVLMIFQELRSDSLSHSESENNILH